MSEIPPIAWPIYWYVSRAPVPYEDAIAFMEKHVSAVREGRGPELVWLLEHPSLYTAGTSAKDSDLLDATRFPVHHSGRGGQFTYHGPGQRVAYVMLDLSKRGNDVRAYVNNLERWLIEALKTFNVKGETHKGRVGIWISRSSSNGDSREDKIAAIGVRVRRSVTYHGVSLNVEPNLEHFSGIVPCGIAEHGVTSLVDLGLPVTLFDADIALKQSFEDVFGKVGPASVVDVLPY